MNTATKQPSIDWSAGYWDARGGDEMRDGRCHEYREGYSAGRIVNGKLRSVEVLPGLELDLLPGENIAATAEQLSDMLAEIDACPWLGDEPTDDEIDAMFLDHDAASDPAYTAWLSDGAPLAGWAWSGDYSNAVPACDRDDWVGA